MLSAVLAACEPGALSPPVRTCAITAYVDTLAQQGYDFPYDLENPDQTFTMPAELREISGLSMSHNGRYLLAVQDEKGTLFYIDKVTGRVKQEIPFAADGDYEGIEAVGKDVYALRSSGTLVRIQHPGQQQQAAKEFNDFLTKSNDVEGLAYDAANHRLLLACKGNDGVAGVACKAIYAFDLKTNQLEPNPLYCLLPVTVEAYLEEHREVDSWDKLREFFLEENGFAPAALAIHPTTGDYYLCSSVGKVMLVMTPAGGIRHIVKLKKKVHPQPEGLCIDTDGTLYVANEGKDGAGVIHCFKPRF